jgi:site-specific DNA recombinase
MEQLRAFVYDRTSRDAKGTASRKSNADQNLENERFCEQQRWMIAGRFTDPGRSASSHARRRRDDYEEMLRRIGQGECDVVVVWEASRAYRDLGLYVELRKVCIKHRVLLCYNGRVYDLTRREDRFNTAFDALRAEDEADAIRERILRTTRLNAERGHPHGRVPYGYRRIYDDRTGELLTQVPHEEHAAVIKEIARRAAGGESLYAIAKSLNERGIPSPTGGTWLGPNLRDLVVKSTYIGKRVHQGTVVGQAQWEPILDEETHYALVQLFADPRRRQSDGNAVRWLLTGTSRCGMCGMGLQAQKTSSGARNLQCLECGRVSIPMPAFDRIVVEALLERIEQPEFAEALVGDPDTDGTRAALAEAQALEAELAQARELAGRWENGRILLSALSLAKMEGELMPRIEAARERAQSASVPRQLRELAGPGARERWGAMEDLTWRRSVVRIVVVPRVFPAGKGVRTIRPERFRLKWKY